MHPYSECVCVCVCPCLLRIILLKMQEDGEGACMWRNQDRPVWGWLHGARWKWDFLNVSAWRFSPGPFSTPASAFSLDTEQPDYDLDSEDEAFVNKLKKKMEITALQFEEMIDRLEKGSGQQVRGPASLRGRAVLAPQEGCPRSAGPIHIHTV